MDDAGQEMRVPAIRFERTLPGPVETVWSHLTDCDRLPAWFGADGRIEPREGGSVYLMGGHVRGVVTRWQPHRQLAYTWNVFDAGEERSSYPESYLDFELVADGSDVKLVLLHLPVLERFEKQNAMGWHTFLDMLGAALRSAAVEPRRTYMERNARLYGVDLANLQR